MGKVAIARLYSGNDSQGNPVEVAQSGSGAWFARFFEFNGFGKNWSRWRVLKDAPTHPDHFVMVYTQERVEIPADRRERMVTWGFVNLLQVDAPLPRYRLPG